MPLILTGTAASTTLDSSAGLTFSDNSNQSAAASPFGLKNRIINGDMVIDQRNAGASVTPVNGAYTLDRWIYQASQASRISIQRNAGAVTSAVGFTNYLGATSLSAYTVGSSETFVVSQRIEGFNISDLNWGTANAQTVTLSFRVRSSLTGTFGGVIGNGNATRSYPFSYTISSANTWTTVSVTIAGDTSGTWATTNSTGIIVYFSLGTGATLSGTAGSWTSSEFYSATGATSVVGTNGATFYITGVQLERNTTATPFEWIPYGQELQLCQRYYEKSYAIGTVPGTVTSFPVTGMSFNGMSNVSGQKYVISTFKVTKRASPTMTYYDAAGTAGRITTKDIGGTNTNNVSIALGFITDSLYGPGANNGTHTGLFYDWTADIEL